MDKIEVNIINPGSLQEAEQMMVAMARLTQRAHKITDMADFMQLIDMPYKPQTVEDMIHLPHPTIQKFGLIHIAIVGASRRFLAQITRHQNEVKFMSGSLQYSDYTGAAQFCIPYEMMEYDAKTIENGEAPRVVKSYLGECEYALKLYQELTPLIGNDAAGYAMPQGLRNVLLISATPFQWKHMISQRTCRRNTLETMYVMLRCWEELSKYSLMFDNAGASCIADKCKEGKMSCKHPMLDTDVNKYYQAYEFSLPASILDVNFKLIRNPQPFIEPKTYPGDTSGC